MNDMSREVASFYLSKVIAVVIFLAMAMAVVSLAYADYPDELKVDVSRQAGEPINLALIDPKRVLFDTLHAAGNSYQIIARELNKQFNMGARSIATLMTVAQVPQKEIIKAVKGGLSASSQTAAGIARDIFKVSNNASIAFLLKQANYSLKQIAKALKNTLGTRNREIARILRNRLNGNVASVANALQFVLHSHSQVITALRQGLNISVATAAGILKASFGFGKNKARQLATIMKNAGYTSQQKVKQLAKFMKDSLAMSREEVKTALTAVYGLGGLVEDALIFAFGAAVSAVVTAANAVAGGFFVGRANNCNRRLVAGNDRRQGRNKFSYFERVSAYRDINHYLAMQASNMTYFKHFKYGARSPQTEAEYRCAAEAKYRSWGFNRVWFVNSVQGANAILADRGDMVLIAIRGTEDPSGGDHGPLESWEGLVDIASTVVNASVPFVLPTRRGLKVGQMHTGYAALMTNFVPVLIDALGRMGVRPKGKKPIFVTGHSLGAATATLSAFSLKLLGYKVGAAYVFASPKVGDYRLNRSIQKTISLYATENYRDPVPTIPFISNILKVVDLGSMAFFPVMDAARQSIYFTRAHRALIFGRAKTLADTVARERQILNDQNVPPTHPPLLLMDGGVMSKEWKFHRGNYYVAYAYQKLIEANPSFANNQALKPEFLVTEAMCLNRSERSGRLSVYQSCDINQDLLVRERYAIVANQCSKQFNCPPNSVASRRRRPLSSVAVTAARTQQQAPRMPSRISPQGRGVDVAVSLVASKRVRRGGGIVYQFLVTNKDKKQSSGKLRLSARIPVGAIYRPAKRSGWTVKNGVVSRLLQRLPASGQQSLRLTLQAMKRGRLRLSVTLQSLDRRFSDPNPANNRFAVTTEVQ